MNVECRMRLPAGKAGSAECNYKNSNFEFRPPAVRAGISKLAWVFVLPLLLVGCAEKIKPSVANIGIGQDVPTQESWNSSITFTDSGRVAVIVHAGHIAVFANGRYTLMDSGIKVDFFDEHEQHTSVLTADRGKVNDATHDLEAYGNVVVISDSGTTMKSQELFWSDARQLIHTATYVDIRSPTEHIQGHGLESDHSLTNYRIFRVTGQAKTNE